MILCYIHASSLDFWSLLVTSFCLPSSPIDEFSTSVSKAKARPWPLTWSMKKFLQKTEERHNFFDKPGPIPGHFTILMAVSSGCFFCLLPVFMVYTCFFHGRKHKDWPSDDFGEAPSLDGRKIDWRPFKKKTTREKNSKEILNPLFSYVNIIHTWRPNEWPEKPAGFSLQRNAGVLALLAP